MSLTYFNLDKFLLKTETIEAHLNARTSLPCNTPTRLSMYQEDPPKEPDIKKSASKKASPGKEKARDCEASSPLHDTSSTKNFTLLWAQAREGDKDALNKLTSLISPELKRIAHILLSKERKGHTLTSNALINELYIRLLGNELITINDRNHFLAIASKRMRFILIDYARRRNNQKNNNGVQPGTLDDNANKNIAADNNLDLIIDVDNALQELEKIHSGWARVVELRYFGGCTFNEIAQIMQINQRRAERYWVHARTWLFNFMQENDPS